MSSFNLRNMQRISALMVKPFCIACLVAVASLGWTAFAAAQVPNTFNNGEVADAENINENFQKLDSDITSLNSKLENFYPSSNLRVLTADCGSNPNSFNTVFANNLEARNLEIRVIGNCILNEETARLRLKYRTLYISGADESSVLTYQGNMYLYAELAAALQITDITLFGESISAYARQGSFLDVENVKLAGPNGSPRNTQIAAVFGGVVTLRYRDNIASPWNDNVAIEGGIFRLQGKVAPEVDATFSVYRNGHLSALASGKIQRLACFTGALCEAHYDPLVAGDNEALLVDSVYLGLNALLLTLTGESCEFGRGQLPPVITNKSVNSGGAHYITNVCDQLVENPVLVN